MSLGAVNLLVFCAGVYIYASDVRKPASRPYPSLSGLNSQPSLPSSFVDEFDESTFRDVSEYPRLVRNNINSLLLTLRSRLEPLSDQAYACKNHKKLQGTECILRATENSNVSDLVDDSSIFDSSDNFRTILSTYPSKGIDHLSNLIKSLPTGAKQVIVQSEQHLFYVNRYPSVNNSDYVFVARLSDSFAQTLIRDACHQNDALTFSIIIPGDGSVTSICRSSPDDMSGSTDALPLGLQFSYIMIPVTWDHDSITLPSIRSSASVVVTNDKITPDRRDLLLAPLSVLILEFLVCAFLIVYILKMFHHMVEKEKTSIDPRRVLVNLHEAMNEILALRTLNSMLRFSDSDKHNLNIHRSTSASISNLVSFVDNLSMSLSDGSEFRLRETDFDLYEFLVETLEIHRLQAENKGLDFVSSIDIEHPAIWHGDPDSLRQVITNIVGNAIKYTDRGSIEIWASIDSNDDRFKIVVDDTGQGVSPSDVENIFEPFIRGDNVSKVVSGLGVGLYVCKMIAEAMQGSITCQHLPEGGTRFIFTGRLHRSDIPLTSEPFKNLVAVIGAEQGDIRTELVQALRKAGMTVDAADDSFTLGAVCERAKYLWKRLDVVVISESLPAQGGKEAMLRLASLDALKDVLICFVGDPSEIKSLPLGHNCTLVKIPTSSSTHDILRLISNGLATNREVPLSSHENVDICTSQNRRILLVEDNPINVTLIKQFLDRKSWSVISVSSGEAALVQLGKSHFDLVLMDLRLPGMSGCETTQQILSMKDQNICTVIGITAHRIEDVVEECSNVGMLTVISKTTGLPKLADAIEKAFVMSHLKTIASTKVPLVTSDHSDESGSLIQNFDVSKFLEFRRTLGDVEARSVVSELFQDLPVILGELRDVLSGGDLDAAYDLIHSNLSVLYSIGAFPLYDYLFEIEEICRSKDADRNNEAVQLCDNAISIAKPYYETIEKNGWFSAIYDSGPSKTSPH